MSGRRSPVDVENLRTRVSDSVEQFVRERCGELLAISDDLEPIVDAAEEIIAGGKRLRAAFCYWGWRATGASDDPAIIQAAAALELLQACALVHDDVMDGSDTRRGHPSSHRRLETNHRDFAWNGSAERFGEGAAILLGDLFLSWSDQLFLDTRVPADCWAEAKRVFDEMRQELMAGQYLDLVAQSRTDNSADFALTVLRYKAAKYTVERPLQLGAVLAGGDAQTVAALRSFGLPLGEAFQLRDDILGVFGDPDVTGKPAGDDLREGKQTVLLSQALAVATGDQRRVLQDKCGDPDLTDKDIATLQGILRDTGALDYVESLIASLATDAEAALSTSTIGEPARSVLHELLVAATHRAH